MSTNTKFTLWLLTIAAVAFAVGRCVEPGKVTTNNSAPSARPGGRAGATPSSPSASGTATANGRFSQSAPTSPLSLKELYRLLDDEPGKIAKLTFVNGKNVVVVERSDKSSVTVKTADDGGKQSLYAKAIAQKVEIAIEEQTLDPLSSALLNAAPILIIIVLVILFSTAKKGLPGASGPGSELRTIGSSRAKDASKTKIKKVTFKDIAGCNEAVRELRRVVQGLVDADVYTLFGAERPKGVLLIGPPGTGKTLLAKAIAGETDGSLDITSGSDFVEMLVGVGAARARDLFQRARKKVQETGKTHIIFIDELDAIGGQRGGGTSAGSNSEREQTLNQILVEMDGMESNDGIIVIAATNRVDMLDNALMRQGRFDCHVSVDLPDKAGREAIFAIHIGERTLDPRVTLDELASRTFGYSGAEIKGICNRAYLLAAERYAQKRAGLRGAGLSQIEIEKQLSRVVTLEDFDEGIDFVRYGNANEGRQARMSKEDKSNTAYHEAGHAVGAAALGEHADAVGKITIMNRAKALGYVQFMQKADRMGYTQKQALTRIVIAMCGRAAQEVYLNTVDTGAQNDFEQACNLARKMVTKWGMSKVGKISVDERLEGVGPALANEIDNEWRRIVRECDQLAYTIVQTEKQRIEALAAALMEKETVLPDEWKSMLERVPSAFTAENPVQLPATV